MGGFDVKCANGRGSKSKWLPWDKCGKTPMQAKGVRQSSIKKAQTDLATKAPKLWYPLIKSPTGNWVWAIKTSGAPVKPRGRSKKRGKTKKSNPSLTVKVNVDRKKGYKTEARQVAKLLQDNPQLKIKVGDYTIELSDDKKSVVVKGKDWSVASVAVNQVLFEVSGDRKNDLPGRILSAYSKVARNKLPSEIDLKKDFAAAQAQYKGNSKPVDAKDLASVPKPVKPTGPFSKLEDLALAVAGTGKIPVNDLKIRDDKGNLIKPAGYITWETYGGVPGVVNDSAVTKEELVQYLQHVTKDGKEATIFNGDYRYTIKDGKILPGAVNYKVEEGRAQEKKARAKVETQWDRHSAKSLDGPGVVRAFNGVTGLELDPSKEFYTIAELKDKGLSGAVLDLMDRGSDTQGSSDKKISISDLRNYLETIESFARSRHISDKDPAKALKIAHKIYNDPNVKGFNMVPKNETKEALAWADTNFAGVKTVADFMGKIPNLIQRTAMEQYAKFAGINGPNLTVNDLVVLKDIYVGLSRLAQLPPTVLIKYFGIGQKLEAMAKYTAKTVLALAKGEDPSKVEEEAEEEGATTVADGDEEVDLSDPNTLYRKIRGVKEMIENKDDPKEVDKRLSRLSVYAKKVGETEESYREEMGKLVRSKKVALAQNCLDSIDPKINIKGLEIVEQLLKDYSTSKRIASFVLGTAQNTIVEYAQRKDELTPDQRTLLGKARGILIKLRDSSELAKTSISKKAAKMIDSIDILPIHKHLKDVTIDDQRLKELDFKEFAIYLDKEGENAPAYLRIPIADDATAAQQKVADLFKDLFTVVFEADPKEKDTEINQGRVRRLYKTGVALWSYTRRLGKKHPKVKAILLAALPTISFSKPEENKYFKKQLRALKRSINSNGPLKTIEDICVNGVIQSLGPNFSLEKPKKSAK